MYVSREGKRLFIVSQFTELKWLLRWSWRANTKERCLPAQRQETRHGENGSRMCSTSKDKKCLQFLTARILENRIFPGLVSCHVCIFFLRRT
jgi:hypothetical protein